MKKMKKSFITTVFVPTLIVGIILFVFNRISSPVYDVITFLLTVSLVAIAFLVCFAFYCHKENKKLLSDICKKLEEFEKKDE